MKFITRREALKGACTVVLADLAGTKADSAPMKPQSLAEQILFCTLRIEAYGPGNAVNVGTGFIFKVSPPGRDDLELNLLFTNKHVVAGSSKFKTVFHLSDSDGNPSGNHAMEISAGLGTGWIAHDRPEIDLCALPIQSILATTLGGKGFARAIQPSNMLADDKLLDLDAIEEVVMYGYPNGLWDQTNNLPLIRRGVTASHPGVDFMALGAPTTVVDMACFPGSSGSPVFVLNNSSYSTKAGGLSVGQRLIFLGALFAGPQVTNDGRIVIKDIPTAAQAVPVVPSMMNLGYLIKAREVTGLASRIVAMAKIPPAAPKE